MPIDRRVLFALEANGDLCILLLALDRHCPLTRGIGDCTKAVILVPDSASCGLLGLLASSCSLLSVVRIISTSCANDSCATVESWQA